MISPSYFGSSVEINTLLGHHPVGCERQGHSVLRSGAPVRQCWPFLPTKTKTSGENLGNDQSVFAADRITSDNPP